MNLLLLLWKLNTLSSCILSLYAYICRQMLSSALVKDVSSCCEQLLMQRLTGGRALKKKKGYWMLFPQLDIHIILSKGEGMPAKREVKDCSKTQVMGRRAMEHCHLWTTWLLHLGAHNSCSCLGRTARWQCAVTDGWECSSGQLPRWIRVDSWWLLEEGGTLPSVM